METQLIFFFVAPVRGDTQRMFEGLDAHDVQIDSRGVSYEDEDGMSIFVPISNIAAVVGSPDIYNGN